MIIFIAVMSRKIEFASALVTSSTSSIKTYVYTYTSSGNITSVKEYEYTTASTISTTLLNTNTYGYTDNAWGDKLTAYNGSSISYNSYGCPTDYLDYEIGWTGRNMTSISKTGLDNTYTYNINGIRTSKTSNGVTTYYTLVDNVITHEQTGNKNLYYKYDTNGDIIGFIAEGYGTEIDGIYFYGKNHVGDIVSIIDKNGNVVAAYKYDVWGKLISATGSDIAEINPFRYRSYYYDSDIEMYYLQSRYYDSEIGRFINGDDELILQWHQNEFLGSNLFVYCSNNPANNADDDGYVAVAVVGGSAGAFGAVGAANFWNPIGWAALGIGTLYISYELYNLISKPKPVYIGGGNSVSLKNSIL